MVDKSLVASVARPISHSVKSRLRRATVQRLLPIGLLALGVVGMPFLLISTGGLDRLSRLRAEQETVQLEISRLSKRIEHLRSQAAALKNDPKTVERSARDQLGLLRRTEIVFHFEQQD